jgi:hypothetical protein
VPFLPQCFDDDEEEKTDDTAMQTSVRVNASADAIDTSRAALRQTLARTDVAMQAVVHRHLDETSLNLDLLRHEVVHRDDGFHLRVEGLTRAIRSSLEAIRAAVDRLNADMRNTVAGHLDAIGAITLNHLGYRLSDQTVGNVLKRHSVPPAPERAKTTTWKEFIRIHMAILGVTDFLVVYVYRAGNPDCLPRGYDQPIDHLSGGAADAWRQAKPRRRGWRVDV